MTGAGQALVIAVMVAILPAVAAAAACSPDVVDLRGPFGTARFSVRVADDPAEQSQGLMFVEAMPRTEGMLFLFDPVRPTSFWMRNTLIPLDMLFVDAAGVVTRIHPRAIPRDETPIPSGAPVRAVLEINGGVAAALGIAPGAELRHPGFAAGTAAWPCD